jgi:hypothetical protein
VRNTLTWKGRWGGGDCHSRVLPGFDSLTFWCECYMVRPGGWNKGSETLICRLLLKFVSSKCNFVFSRSVWIHLCPSEAGKVHRSDFELESKFSICLSVYSSIEMKYLSGKSDPQTKYCQMFHHGNRADVVHLKNNARHFLRVTAHLPCLVPHLLRAPDRTHIQSYQQHTHWNPYGSLQTFFTREMCSGKI